MVAVEKVENVEEIRRGVLDELRDMAVKALARVEMYVAQEEWDKAIGALGSIEYVLRCAKEVERVAK